MTIRVDNDGIHVDGETYRFNGVVSIEIEAQGVSSKRVEYREAKIKAGDKFVKGGDVYRVAHVRDDCIIAEINFAGCWLPEYFGVDMTKKIVRLINKYKKHGDKHRKILFG